MRLGLHLDHVAAIVVVAAGVAAAAVQVVRVEGQLASEGVRTGLVAVESLGLGEDTILAVHKACLGSQGQGQVHQGIREGHQEDHGTAAHRDYNNWDMEVAGDIQEAVVAVEGVVVELGLADHGQPEQEPERLPAPGPDVEEQ